MNSDGLLNLCGPQFPHVLLLSLCGKDKRIHVHMAHSTCSDKVGIFSCYFYYLYLILKPAAWPTLQIQTLRLREVKGLPGEYNFATMILAQSHIRIHAPYPSR